MKVAVIMGSSSDWKIMKESCSMLEEFEIPYEKKVVSAHRTPQMMFNFARQARQNGFDIIIAGAGGAALTWNGSFHDNIACDWCTNRI